MLVLCFPTAFSEMNSRWAIALFDRPSAISLSTSRSRAVSRVIGLSRARRPISFLTTSGSMTVPPAAAPRSPPAQQLAHHLGVHAGAAGRDRADRVGEPVVVEHPVLEQVADGAGGLDRVG